MHPQHFQAMRLLIGQLASQLQAAHQTASQLHQTLSAAGQLQQQPPQAQQQQAQQQGFQGYMAPQEEQALDQAMMGAQAQAAQQIQEQLAAMTPHHPARRQQSTPGFPGQHPQAGMNIPRQPMQQQPPFQPQGVQGPQGFGQTGAGQMLGGLDIDSLLNGGF